MSIEIDLSGRAALVTGGGRGIGRSVALSLAEAGADVCVTARTQEQIDETAGMIEKLGRRALALKTDVTDYASVEKAVRKTIEELGDLHILVNNAGTRNGGDVLELSEADWSAVIDTNVTGVFLCTKAAGKHMVKKKYGKIINTASTGGMHAGRGQANYHASKAAVINFTRAAAMDLARYNINVNAIAPGWIETDMIAPVTQDRDLLGKFIKAIPMRRLGKPAEMGPLVAFLASDLAAYITGTTIVIDGGLIIP